MSRLVDIDNYLVLENGTIKETSLNKIFKFKIKL